MSRFLEALRSGRVLLMDGAMGTELIRAGLPPGEPCESWNLTHPERVQAIHQAYVDAGAEVLLTNTFRWNRDAGVATGMAIGAIGMAQEASECQGMVLFDIGPLGAASRRQEAWWGLKSVSWVEADGLLVETASDTTDLAFILKIRDRSKLKPIIPPVLMSWTYCRNRTGPPRTVNGWLPEQSAEASCRFDITALGVNCGRDIGMDEVIEIVRRYRQVTDLPLFARPNAGTPKRDGDRWIYPLTPSEMARRLPELLEAGVAMVGGCCGTTPEHIAAMRPVVEEWNRSRASQS